MMDFLLDPEAMRRLARPNVSDLPALESADTAWSCHVPFAFWLVEALRPRTLVELGVHAGVSYCAFCQAVDRLGLTTSAYGVDTWEGDVHAGHYEPAVLEQLRRHHDPRYASFSHLVRSTFAAAREHFAPGSIDLLHIDGLHTFEAVHEDFESWRPLLSQRAVVLFHDTQVRERDFGVWRLWEELRERFPSFEFPFGHGLGVLGVGAELPAEVEWLLHPERRAETPDAAIAGFFHFLGQRLEARAGMARALAVLNHAEAQRDDLARQEKSQREEIARMHEAIARMHEAAGQLQTQCEAARAETQTLHSQLAARNADVAALTASTSWRVTAPLRATVGLLRGAVRRARRLRQNGLRSTLATFAAAPPVAAKLALRPDYPLRERWYDAQSPTVSLIVLNFNKPELTVDCVDSIFAHTEGHRYEVVLVDNGSTPEAFMRLAPLEGCLRLVRIGVNRFFGEGNNLGVEASRGRYLVFLNNDVTVTAGWLQPLIERLERDATIGATGPKMLYPDGRLQEAGARIRPDGLSEQFGKGGDPDDPAFNEERDVDYISAAALAMRRADFDAVLGFDLLFEPAYYEDVDLCMRLRQKGLRVRYCPDAMVFHHENATSRDFARELQIAAAIELNRERFLARWGAVLRGESTDVPGLLPAPAAAAEPATGPALLLYTPYALVPGGGERYLLTIAAALSRRMRVTLATAQPYSHLRLRTLGRELSLDLDAVRIAPYERVAGRETFDLAMVMGNELLPSLPAPARRSVFICQFPFPIDSAWLAARWDNLVGYERIVVYSAFVERHYRRLLAGQGKQPPPIEIVSPPAVLAPPASADAPIAAKRRMIVSVGRFFVGGHSKRHDLMIEAFRQVHRLAPDAELHLAGSLAAHPGHATHFQSLRKAAENLPIHFHANASPELIARLYDEASLYWHLAGFGVNELVEPHRCEHFGITVVEAMSAGCVPLVCRLGGPAATVNDGVTGYVFDSLDGLAALSARLLATADDDPALRAMRSAAVAASREYSEAAFGRHAAAVLEACPA